MNALRTVTRWIFVICVPVLLLTLVLAWAFNSRWIYEAGFAKYHVGQELGLSDPELRRAASELIAYFNDPHQQYLDINVRYDNGETTPLLDQADISHMKDVKGVLWLDYRLCIASAIYMLAYALAAILLLRRGRGPRDLAFDLKRGGIATLGLLAFLGVFAVTSFDWFFTTFHEIFFPQGNWQFPPGDHMITMFPDGFWSDTALLVGLVTAGLAVLVTGAGVIWGRIINRHESQNTG
jgi:integral membrane protein (TIGR01906 family)